jgi:phage/plasmid primase-like uncharacterized protein
MFVRSEVNYGAISDFIIANPSTSTAIKVTDQNKDSIQPAKKAKRDKEATEAAEAQAEVSNLGSKLFRKAHVTQDDHYNVYGLIAALNTKELKVRSLVAWLTFYAPLLRLEGVFCGWIGVLHVRPRPKAF